MAACGRCLICGYKFNGRLDDGTAPDEAVRWPCSRGDRCSRATARDLDELGETHEHALCVTCHDHLVDDDTISAVAQALLAMVRERVRVRAKPEPNLEEMMLAAYVAGANDASDGVKCKRSTFLAWRDRHWPPSSSSIAAKYPPSCRRCNDRGVIKTGNNDLPCDCPAGDNVLFNTEGGTLTGAEIKARRR